MKASLPLRSFLVALLGWLAAPSAHAAAAASSEEGQVVERILVIVDDQVVLLSEVEAVMGDIMRAEPPAPGVDPHAYREARQREVIDTLIAEKLIEREMKKLQIEVTEAEVNRIIEGTKQQHGLDDAKLVQALAQQGLTLAEYQEGLKKQLMRAKIIQLKVKNRVQVTDQEVQAQLAQRAALDQDEFRVRARHILILAQEGAAAEPERQRALAAKARIEAGEDFGAVANEVSEGPSAKNGGALGVFGRGEMVPAFERAAFGAAPGQVVGPVRTSFGWHVIWVEERIPVAGTSGNAAEEQVRQQLYEAEVERAFRQYIEELKQAAHIEMRI